MEIITSSKNPLIQDLVRLKSSSSYRKETQRVLLEGYNCIQEISRSVSPLRLFITEEWKEKLQLLCPTYCLTEPLMKKISSVKTPGGVIAEFALPSMHELAGIKRLVICDAVSDPGNLGTIVRTAYALGWDGIFFLEGSCDPFNDKALRAAKGATFLMPWRRGSWQECVNILEKNRLALVVADMQGQPPEHCHKERMALLLGNEAHGPRVVSEIPYDTVAIPMRGSIDSLNVAVAGAILMYMFTLP